MIYVHSLGRAVRYYGEQRTTMRTKDDFSTSEFRLKSRAAETLLTTAR